MHASSADSRTIAANAASSCFTCSACLFSIATSTSAPAYRSASAFNSRSFRVHPGRSGIILARTSAFILEFTSAPARSTAIEAASSRNCCCAARSEAGQLRARSLIDFFDLGAPRSAQPLRFGSRIAPRCFAQLRYFLVEPRNLRARPRAIRGPPAAFAAVASSMLAAMDFALARKNAPPCLAIR